MDSWWQALGLVLVIEGLMPLVAPGRWRTLFRQMLALQDGQLRFMGLLLVLVGAVVLLW